MRKGICLILMGIFALLALYAGGQILREHIQRQESAGVYAELEEFVSLPETPEPMPPAGSSGQEEAQAASTGVPVETTEDERPLPAELPGTEAPGSAEGETAPLRAAVDFAGLREINGDCVAWIYIRDTAIHYPVVQGRDNSHYLTHLFNGERNSAGSIFLDARVACDLSDRHSILYGHHRKDGSMFSGLVKYKEQDYYEAHPEGRLITPEGSYRLVFFAGYVASDEEPAWRIDFASDDAFARWLQEAKEKSWFRSPVTPTAGDRILTLSTCSYEFHHAKFVLHAILVER